MLTRTQYIFDESVREKKALFLCRPVAREGSKIGFAAMVNLKSWKFLAESLFL